MRSNNATLQNDEGKGSKLTQSNISIKDGNLILDATIGNDDNYFGAEVRSTNYYNYGYFEIRAKINSSKGICPAFWLLGSRDSASKIEYEVDVFECFGNMPNIIKSTLLAHNYPNGSSGGKESTAHRFNYNRLLETSCPKNDLITYDENVKNTFFEGNWGEEYHIYGLDWKPDLITWYVDNKPILSAKPSDALGDKYIYNEPMQIVLTCYSGRDVCSPLTGLPDETTDWENGSSLNIDYLRVYQYNS